ncbi:hypothetical protein K9N50_01800 [bacterium]|nr:hypothetical protein [bacterium]
MKNTHVSLVRLLSVFVFILSGCSTYPRFENISVDSPQSALIRLTERSRSLKIFKAETDFFLTTSKGRYRLSGNVLYSLQNGWQVEIFGPLSIKLAVIKSINDGFQISLPQNGTIMNAKENEPIDIPEVEASFPNLSYITTLLLPVLPFDGDTAWRLAGGDNGDSGSLSLLSNRNDTIDSLVVSLDYSTLRVIREELWNNGEKRYIRTFESDSKSDYFPDRIKIKMNDLELYIKYRKVKANFDKTRAGIS